MKVHDFYPFEQAGLRADTLETDELRAYFRVANIATAAALLADELALFNRFELACEALGSEVAGRLNNKATKQRQLEE